MTTRTISPFIAFCHANRDAVKAANPDVSFGDMGRILSCLWKEKNESESKGHATPCHVYDLRQRAVEPENAPELRRSSRLRNKRLGLNFWGLKEKK